MIPLQLKIRNFLSYGQQTETIDFTPHRLICLTGKNGHGKSAMLDAITWALWGQARKIAGITRGDEHLIRLGESSMTVTLDFSCNNQRYRITRDFSVALNKKGLTQLHLGLFRDDLDAYVSLSEKNIRDTQEKLDGIIGLDYETFINSVFLRQGQANEFSKKSPLERKEVLSALLGLSRYEELRKRALELQRGYLKEEELLSHLTKSLTDELAVKQEVTAQAEAIEKELARITETEKDYKLHHDLLVLKQQENTYAQTTLALAVQSQEQQTRVYEQQRDNLITLLGERRGFQRRKDALDVAALTAAHETAVKNLAACETLKATQMSVREKFYAISAKRQKRLELIQTELQAESQAATNQLNLARFEAERAENSLVEVNKKIANLETQNRDMEKKKAELQHALSQQAAVNTRAETIERKIIRATRFAERWELRKQRNIETETTARIRYQNLTTHGSVCPLCTQALPEKQRGLLIKQAEKNARLHAHQHTRLEKLLKQLHAQKELDKSVFKKLVLEKEQLIQHNQQFVQIAEQLVLNSRELEILTEHRAGELTQATLKKELLVQAQTRHNTAAAALKLAPTQDPALCTLTREVVTLEEQIQLLEKSISNVNESTLRAEIARINEQQKAVTLLSHEQAQNRRRAHDIIAIIRELRINTREQEALKTTITKLTPLVSELLANNEQLQKIRKELERLQLNKQLLFEQKGALSRQLAVFGKRARELEDQQKRLVQLKELIEDHQLLAQALSKNGIQALIIEQAVPELESEANTLLARLTDNQAQVMFESLRDLKSGGSKETLDIKISDAMGTRPYELFSGGEAFRIDFALRIALSKLLARRAGTSLQTLIIDEGFGSQDEEGLALIQEALHVIQEDFEKIIVVSHLPAMKHQFPTNFVVRKGTEGSTVTVVEQG